jgi:hypothetical protein
MNKRTLIASALALALAVASQAQAADVVPVNFDGPGEGYNDATPATPVGGNPGTTIGEQRQIVAQFAADLWGAVLQSNQPVYVGAQFNPLGANVLGSAGASSVFSDFPNAGVANTWYSSALADAIAGEDLNPGFTDIGSQFSSDFTFYYGLDGNTPAGQISFLDVVMHEFGHGLGFQNFESEAAGTFFLGVQDIYSTFTFDNSTGKRWTQMSVAERQASALNYGKVVFDGANATQSSQLVLGPRTASTSPPRRRSPVTTPTVRPPSAGSVAGELRRQRGGRARRANARSVDHRRLHGDHQRRRRGRQCRADGSRHLRLRGQGQERAGCRRHGRDHRQHGATAAQNPPPGMGGVDPLVVIPSILVTQALATRSRPVPACRSTSRWMRRSCRVRMTQATRACTCRIRWRAVPPVRTTTPTCRRMRSWNRRSTTRCTAGCSSTPRQRC